jgi:hypothetical protein
MAVNRIVLCIAAAGALVGLGGCDRVEALGQLASDALSQLTGGAPAPSGPHPSIG